MKSKPNRGPEGQAVSIEPLESRAMLSVSFGPITAYEVGRKPVYLASGDFDGDGRDDLAAAILARDRINVLTSNPDGTFAERTTLETRNPRAVTSADFNGDGFDDLAAADPSDNDGGLNVFLSKGDGTFQPRIRNNFDNAADAITAADVNSDGKIDLLISTNKRIGVLISNGDGTFAPIVRYQVGGERVKYISTADLNADGALDLVLTIARLDSISVLLGQTAGGVPTGTFGEKTLITAGRSPLSTAVGDFNADGKPDVAVANYGFRINGLSVLLGNGDGTFAPRTPYSTRFFSETVLAGDLDADGKDEVILAPANGPYQAYEADANGAFTPAGEFQATVERKRGTTRSILGDFNGDGKPDLAGIAYSRARVSVLLNTST